MLRNLSDMLIKFFLRNSVKPSFSRASPKFQLRFFLYKMASWRESEEYLYHHTSHDLKRVFYTLDLFVSPRN